MGGEGGVWRRGMTSVECFEKSGVTVVRLHGALTYDGIAQVGRQFEDATGRPGTRAVVDLTDVEMVTTPALSMFIAAATSAKKSGGSIVFTESPPPVTDVMKRLRLHAVLKTVTGLDEAIEAAKTGGSAKGD